MRTGSNPPDINQFQMNTRKTSMIFIFPKTRALKSSNDNFCTPSNIYNIF